MRIRRPPGRAGRPWLVRRLELAHRGADVLDQKRQALLREEHRLERQLDAAREDWQTKVLEAESWLDRALTLGGAASLRRAIAATADPAAVTVTWTNVLGIRCPEARLDVPPATVSPSGGSSAVAYAARSARDALEAAARFASSRTAHRRIRSELAATNRRLRAIEERWIPAHEAELAALELSLDEGEREDAARARWTREQFDRTRADAEGTPRSPGTL